METRSELVGDVHVLHLCGRLDLAAAPEFGALLASIIAGGEIKMLMDCGDLSYVSSSGLSVFIAGSKELAPNAKLAFAELSPQILYLFGMAGVTNLFAIHATVDDALRAFGAAPQ